MNRSKHKILGCLGALVSLLLAGCYSNNCPLNNTVLCNYSFYDTEGHPIVYTGHITVTTLKPGEKTVYVYRKLGELTVTKDYQDAALVSQGYTETITRQRNDTVLLNKVQNAAAIAVPMSYFNDADTLVLAYSNISSKDTIRIRHDSYPHVELPECGTYRFHTLRSIEATDAAIDHIEISNPKVGYAGEENVKIYFNGVAAE